MAMRRYKVTTTFKSTFVTPDDIRVGEFHLKTTNTNESHNLAVSLKVEASSWREAISVFIPKTKLLLDAIFIGSGSAITWYDSNYLVERDGSGMAVLATNRKLRDNRISEHIRPGVIEDIRTAYENLKVSNSPNLLLRQATSTTDARTATVLGIFAVENLAGTKIDSATNREKTDYKKAESIIGKALKHRYFDDRANLENKSLRTSMAHGTVFDIPEDDIKEVNSLLKNSINYVRKQYGIHSDLEEASGFDQRISHNIGLRLTDAEVSIFELIKTFAKGLNNLQNIGYEPIEIPEDY